MIVMYTSTYCPWCQRAQQLLTQLGHTPDQYINVDLDPQARLEMMNLTGRRTVPQIFIHGHHVGGHDDLVAAHKDGQLALWLKGPNVPNVPEAP